MTGINLKLLFTAAVITYERKVLAVDSEENVFKPLHVIGNMPLKCNLVFSVKPLGQHQLFVVLKRYVLGAACQVSSFDEFARGGALELESSLARRDGYLPRVHPFKVKIGVSLLKTSIVHH